jgi:adenylate kinase
MNKILFVGGVHGVGKTYFCRGLVNDHGFVHYSASELIANQKKQSFDNSKRVAQVNENQYFLIRVIEELFIDDDEILLIDGHFCLFNQASQIVRIPEQIFGDLSPAGVILLVDHPESIYNRLISRDHVSPLSLDLIESLQQEEINHGKEVTLKLQIPFQLFSTIEGRGEVDLFIQNII